jgi:hypothetical protein
MKMKKEQIDIGDIVVPIDYSKLNDKQKKAICDNLIDTLLMSIDRVLPPHINRIQFLDEVLISSIQSNNDLEQYEVSQTLYDMRKRLDLDN